MNPVEHGRIPQGGKPRDSGIELWVGIKIAFEWGERYAQKEEDCVTEKSCTFHKRSVRMMMVQFSYSYLVKGVIIAVTGTESRVFSCFISDRVHEWKEHCTHARTHKTHMNIHHRLQLN